MATETIKISKWRSCLFIFVGLSLIGTCVTICMDKKPAVAEAPKSEAEIRKEKISKAFSAWDGSNKNLVASVKEVMNDPESFEHVETRYREQGDSLFLIMTFRGKNAFGGVITNTVTCFSDLNGNLMSAPKMLK